MANCVSQLEENFDFDSYVSTNDRQFIGAYQPTTKSAVFLKCGLNSVLNVKGQVVAFNQDLVRAYSVIVKTDGSFAALVPAPCSCDDSRLTRAATLQCCRRWRAGLQLGNYTADSLPLGRIK